MALLLAVCIKLSLESAETRAYREAAGMSRPTLARRFVRAIGELPLQRLARLRMVHAAELLETTEDALSRIAPRWAARPRSR